MREITLRPARRNGLGAVLGAGSGYLVDSLGWFKSTDGLKRDIVQIPCGNGRRNLQGMILIKFLVYR